MNNFKRFCKDYQNIENYEAAKKGKHLSEEHKNKIAEVNIGMHFFNNGEINIRAKECPPGFVIGMLKRK